MGRAHRAPLTALLIASPAAFAAPAQAQDAAQFQTRMQACGTIKDKSDRLACYDSATRAAPAAPATVARAAPPTAAVPAAAERNAPPALATTPAQSFGIETVRRDRPDRPKPLDRITARAVSAQDNGIGHWLITLDNGARWQLLEREPDFIPPRRDEAVQIRRGALGGYLMDLSHQNSVRVTRID